MDPELVKQHQAFHNRAKALPVVDKKSSVVKKNVLSDATGSVKHVKKKKPKRPTAPKNKGISESIKQVARSALRSNNIRLILKSVVDLMKERYLSGDELMHPLSLEEILTEINLVELRTDSRQQLYEALKDNPKMHYYPEADRFLFKPALGHSIRKKDHLLSLLKDFEREGLGGIKMTAVSEAIPRAERSVQKLKKQVTRITKGERDKEEILFYNNPEYNLDVDEVFVNYWRSVSVENSEAEIERYLQNVGLGAMQGEGRKRKAPAHSKAKKKSRSTKVMNTHLQDSGLLKDFTEDTAN